MSDYQSLPDSTRVWIYQSNRPFPAEAEEAVREQVKAFATSWISHNRQLRAFGDLLHRRFVVLMVDESQADASGCSIDKSVYFLKDLQATYGVDLFDRMHFTVQQGEEVVGMDREAFARSYAAGALSDETLVFDTLVSTKGDFDRAFVKPLGESWHKRLV